MSTLRVNAIQNTSGVEQYLAKAWVNFNGTGTVAIRAAGNVSSITDNGVGDYTVNFTNAMPDANYAISGSASGNNAQSIVFSHTAATTAPSASACRVFCSAGGSGFDSTHASVAIFR